MAEDLHYDAGSDASSGQQSRAAVAGIVQPDHSEPGGLRDAGERAAHVAAYGAVITRPNIRAAAGQKAGDG